MRFASKRKAVFPQRRKGAKNFISLCAFAFL
jgi:hypothetical protein